ncbi:DUF4352 domain-containing protein [Marinitenerispora sediminis]|uniref:DUF4352 domain-containing protein n=1 Tax=Marinitenerispora sediminis TaxID=1931232 RepID=A0A368T227_9ACTN|nr:hypothetical protein [Marinitenerispora sediminis]RCV48883.1 hypothetical protein DEF28_22320 [Marinitenerispora sediminis]RCV51333.1 hypothetical protein DEF23_20605 [Marinitenerispora sediminis]RCV54920.1 hypothetical protein DEF24_18625 [Marinitenerispora sediminis]
MASPLLRRAATALASLLLLGGIVAAHAMRPAFEDATAPIGHRGSAHEPVDARRFTIEVEKVEFAHAVSDGDALGAGPRLTADPGNRAIWVVVWATMTATDASLTVPDPVLLETGSGYSYAASDRLSNALNAFGTRLDPGIPRHGAFAFEVPRERLTDPTLTVSAREGLDDRLSASAEVGLGLDADRIERLVDAAADSLAIEPVTYR